MRNVIFLIVCAIAYAFFIYRCLVALRRLKAEPEKYKLKYLKMEGRAYRHSFWHESSYRRYGKGYKAACILTISSVISFTVLICGTAVGIQRFCLTPSGCLFLRSDGIYALILPSLFFSIAFSQFLIYTLEAPIFTAARRYDGYGKTYPQARKHMLLLLLIMGAVCLPPIALGANANCYADNEKLVSHKIISPVENELYFSSLSSVESRWSCDAEEDKFRFDYLLISSDGTEIDMTDHGIKNCLRFDEHITRLGIEVRPGIIDPASYSRMLEICAPETLEFIERCFIVEYEH